MSAHPLISLRDVSVHDGHGNTLLEVTLDVTNPGVVAIVGPKGAGKSLLLQVLSGRLPRSLVAHGQQVGSDGEGAPHLEPPVGPHPPLPRGTLLRALTHSAPSLSNPEEAVAETFADIGLWDEYRGRLSQPVRAFSTVEQIVIASCRRLIIQEPYLLLDDPSAKIPSDEFDVLARAIFAISKRIPVLWATRSLRHVASIATRILVIDQGRIIGDDTSDKVVVAPGIQAESVLERAAGHTVAYGLDELYHELLELGSRAERAIHQAVQALTDQNLPIAREVIENDNLIDAREREIHDRALALIGRMAPVGRDLRTLVTVIKAAADLERIADHAVNISEVTLAIGEDPLIKPLIDIPRMAERAQMMVRTSLDALVRRDVHLAREVFAYDKPMDALYRELFEELLGFVTDGGDAYRAGQALYLLFVARYLQRVADHATNIAEHVTFMVSGKQDPRHVDHEPDALPHPFSPR